jgi:CBS domain-containing protein
MLIKGIMARHVRTCAPSSTVGQAAEIMRASGRSCLPVVDHHQRLVGVVSDRDVCDLVASRRDPWNVAVGDVMSTGVVTCSSTDYIHVALVAMKELGVRCVPVVDASRHVEGLVSIDDVILHTGAGSGMVPAEGVLDVLRHVCATARP